MRLSFIKYTIVLLSFIQIKVVVSQPVIQPIDIASAFDLKGTVNCSEFADEMEYVLLESGGTIPRCGAQTKVIVNSDYIITVSHSNILLFERKTGKFIREIGKKGVAANQYSSTNYVLPFDEKKNIFLTKGPLNAVLEYDINGNLVREIRTPANIGNTIYWKDNLFVQYISNITGAEDRRLILFTSGNNALKIYPNTQKYSKKGEGFYYSNREGMFYKFDDSLFFKETFNDTVFCVTEAKLVPRYVFQTGDYRVSYRAKAEINLQTRDSFLFIENLYETPDYLFFLIRFKKKYFASVYFKKQNKCKVSYSDEPLRYGFKNDIDDFLPFHLSSVSTENELVGYCLPFEIKHWFLRNKNVKKIPLATLRTIEENDNPLVVIAKLTEK